MNFNKDNNKLFAAFAVILGVIAVSSSAILIRSAKAPPVIIAFYRMFFSSLILFPFFMSKRNKSSFYDKDFKRYSILSGVFLALHFFFWITSLSYTSIISSVIFVSLHPIFVSLFSFFFLKEKISKKIVIGILLTISGIFIISLGSNYQNDSTLLGDGLAILGAIMMAGYLIIGRKVRQKASNLDYTFWVYSIASMVLLFLMLIIKLPLYQYTETDYLIFLLLAIIPTLMGHSVFNWALKKLPTTFISVMILGEPVGAAFLAWIILNEPPGVYHYYGGVFILSGLLLTLLSIEN